MISPYNNAALVLMGILYGLREDDPAMFYEKAICLSVHGGWDTDCNGATAGSVVGALVGGSKLPDMRRSARLMARRP